ncbi:hypothetical protein JCM5350_001189 [Sporobolomyces pararoseus]
MEASSQNGSSGGVGGNPPHPPTSTTSTAPFEITVLSGEVIELDLNEMFNAPTLQESIDQLNDLVGMLQSEKGSIELWVRFVQECWKRGRYASALYYADQGIKSVTTNYSTSSSQIPLLLLKANYHLSLSRIAPKLRLTSPKSTTNKLSLPKDQHHPESWFAQTVFPGNNYTSERDRRQEPMLKQDYYDRVEKDLTRVEGLERGNKVARDLKASLNLSRGKFDQANQLFNQILEEEPFNLMALTGRARILFSKLSFRPALKLYQQILQIEPTFLPDPRIGIGLCFYFLNDREKAKKSWERSIVVNPSTSNSAQTLLGLLHLNNSRNPSLPGGTKTRTEAYETGLKLLRQVFSRDNTVSSCMGPLGNHYLLQGGENGLQAAMKLFERSLQFSETRLLIAESYFNLGRTLDTPTTTTDQDAGGFNTGLALVEFQKAVEANPDMIIAHLAVASCYIRTEQFPAAINAYETLLRKHPQTIEALVSLASIHTYLTFTFHSLSDSSSSRKLAKENYDSVLRIISQSKNKSSEGGGGIGLSSKSERIKKLIRDEEMFTEMARLWQDDSKIETCHKFWQEVRKLKVDKLIESLSEDLDDELYEEELEKAERKVDARVRNNLGVLLYNKKNFKDATGHFELALGTIGKQFSEQGNGELDGGETDAVLTQVTFNLACCYEKVGDFEKAREGWENVLRGHPEFVDAKARLALLELNQSSKFTNAKDKNVSWDRAHVHLKEALTSSPNNPELRSLYTYFLFSTFQLRLARDFSRQTLKEISRHDLYALCSSGIISYLEARENKGESKEALKERQIRFCRSAEFFDKALQLDPMCAVAAQGLAISLAEGNLGNPTSTSGDPSSSTSSSSSSTSLQDSQTRQKNARDALLILTKVKESINESSVYVNLGHCHLSRDEFEKAAENYSVASKRYLEEKSSTVLWYISRSWYFKALKESSFTDLEKSIKIGQQAFELYPKDLSSIFNMAVLKQKGLEILISKTPETRTSNQLRKAFEYLESSQTLFSQLMEDKTPQKPYAPDVPRHRSSYGRSLISRFQSILETQLAYEETETGKINQARQAREEARSLQLAEQKRIEEERKRQEEALAEQRKKMREEAGQWAALSKEFVDDSDDDKKTSRKKGGAVGGGGKKRKSTKIKGGEESEASSTEDDEQPKKKKKAAPKKEKKSSKKSNNKADSSSRAMEVDEHYDEDDEDAPIRAPGRKRKGKSSALVKSAEFIDSDDDEE